MRRRHGRGPHRRRRRRWGGQRHGRGVSPRDRRAGLQGRVGGDRARHRRRRLAARCRAAHRTGAGRTLRRAPLHRARSHPPGRAGRPAAAPRRPPAVRLPARRARPGAARHAPAAACSRPPSRNCGNWRCRSSRWPRGWRRSARSRWTCSSCRSNLAASGERARDDAALVQLDVEFHALVGRASHNRALMLAREPVGLLYNPTLLQMFARLPQATRAQPGGAPAHRRRAAAARRRCRGRMDRQAHGGFSTRLRDGRPGHGRAHRDAGLNPHRPNQETCR